MDKREKILAAALELFVEKGLQATPMSAVARRAGTGMGTIYHHFESKEELVNAIFLDIKTKEYHYIFHDLDDDRPIRTQFEHIYERLIRFFFSHPAAFRFIDQYAASPVIQEPVRREGYARFDRLFATLRRGQEQRIVKEAPVEQLNAFVYGGISNFLRPNIDAGNALTPEMLQVQLEIAWDAIKK